MNEKLSHLSTSQKSLLIKKLCSFPAKAVTEPVDLKKPFGYQIPVANFHKITCKNYQLPPPGPGQIQIQARAIGLNFRDLMIGLGLYPAIEGLPSIMGGDYSGIVIACGEGVTGFKIRDEVIAISSGDPQIDAHFCSQINIYTVQAVHKPSNLSFQEACCIPTVFLTAYYGLCHLANLLKDETVLIHSASGGVGLAAIQIAQWRSANILATAGNDEKRSYLQSLGIKQIMNSRSLEFCDEVMKYTGGAGIDVILNTLPGNAIDKGLQLLKNFGRFIHLDKGAVYQGHQISLSLFKKSLSFSFLDLSLLAGDPIVKDHFIKIRDLFDQGAFSPLPFRQFSHSNINGALSYMALSKHIGKIVLSFEDEL